MIGPLSDDEIKFLQHSNYIEGEDGNIEQPAIAWKYIKRQPILTSGVICQAHKYLMIDKPYPPPLGWYRNMAGINVRVGSHRAPHFNKVPMLMEQWAYKVNEGQMDWREAHIEFERIHPFADGNGRIGRILMNWQRLRDELPLLVITEDERFNYYRWFTYYL